MVELGIVTVFGYSVQFAVAVLVVVVPAIVLGMLFFVNVSVTVVPLLRLVIVQSVPLYVPVPCVLAVNPFGSVSLMSMFVAVSGPLLVIVIVNVPVSPTFIGVVPVLVMDKPACLVYIGVLVVVVGWLLYSVWLVLVAVLVVLVPAIVLPTVPVMFSVAVCPVVSVGIVHIPFVNVPIDGLIFKFVSPDGMMSVMFMFVAVSGPLLVAFTV